MHTERIFDQIEAKELLAGDVGGNSDQEALRALMDLHLGISEQEAREALSRVGGNQHVR